MHQVRCDFKAAIHYVLLVIKTQWRTERSHAALQVFFFFPGWMHPAGSDVAFGPPAQFRNKEFQFRLITSPKMDARPCSR